jgi:myosin-5
MEEGSLVWCKGGPDLWQSGSITKKVLSGKGHEVTVALDGNAGTKKVELSANDADESEELKLRNVIGQATIEEGSKVEDLTALTYLHEPAILHSLSERYKRKTIYTYTGPILLAVNPFQKVPLYTDELLTSYKLDGERRVYDPNFVDTKAPHVYALADKAYRNMTMPAGEESLRSQSILVSGESGAGKTETCKIIMKYLAILGNASGSHKQLGEIETQVLQSNPILEAFGNARTVRNDNSSRFGKYIQLLFSEFGRLQGATIKTFLLEKIRVVRQTALERNYHIFYIMDAGATAEQRGRWELKAIKDYHYTNQSGCYDRRDGVTDSELHSELMGAFRDMGISAQEYTNCMDVVAMILALGNVKFVEVPGAKDDQTQAQVTEGSKHYLATCARLMGVEPSEIVSALTSRQVTAGLNHQVTIYLTPEQANHARDALAKAIYAAMFQWIVQRTNMAIDKENAGAAGEGFTTDKTFIGLLDIFGFEIFKQNYFEQFLINYANEVLQQQFNDFVFRQEQEEYRREQIEWQFIEFPDNRDCIDLIEKKPNGIIPTLDEQCLIGRATDDRYARELYKKCEGNARFEVSNKMRVDHEFIIKHYAGDVNYSSKGIIEKNRDTLAQEGVDLLLGSSNEFVTTMGEIESNMPRKGQHGGLTRTASQGKYATLKRSMSRRQMATKGAPRRSTIGAKSLGSQFKDNLNALIRVVNKTHPHYVRCIKPNDELKANIFNYERIAEQLRNAGVLEVVRVARAGFPVRLGIQDFVERYGMVAVAAVEAAYLKTMKEAETDQEQYVCKELVKAILMQLTGHKPSDAEFNAVCRENGLQMGLTKVFFQQKAFNKVEKLRTAIVAKAALVMQTFWRCYSARRKYLIAKGVIAARDNSRRERNIAALVIQRLARSFIGKLRARKALAMARRAKEEAFEARLQAVRDEYEAKIALVMQEMAEVKSALTAARMENEELRNRPASFVVMAAPICKEQSSTISAQLQEAMMKAGLQGAKTMVFDSSA